MKHAAIESHRCVDGLVYRFEPAGMRNGRPCWRRVDGALWLAWTERSGWTIADAQGEVLGRPWASEREEQGAMPPDGTWVSRKGARSYVYEHRYVEGDLTAEAARALGWPKLTYARVERERRWLCREVPRDGVARRERIEDVYVTGTRLRLRTVRGADGEATMWKLGCKSDVTASVRLTTSIYLTADERAVLAALPGRTLRKTRHHLAGTSLAIDEFHGPLQGLVLAEAEFDSAEAMASYAAPALAVREVTDDVRYTGGALVAGGVPDPA